MSLSSGNFGQCPCTLCMTKNLRRRGKPAVRSANLQMAGGGSGGERAGAGRRSRYAGTRADGSGLPPLHHVGMVVNDLDRTRAGLSVSLGVGPAFPFEGVFPNAVLANGETGLWLKGAFVSIGNTALEIIEPMDECSPHAGFLRERGEGLHHLAYWVDRSAMRSQRCGTLAAIPKS